MFITSQFLCREARPNVAGSLLGSHRTKSKDWQVCVGIWMPDCDRICPNLTQFVGKYIGSGGEATALVRFWLSAGGNFS